MPTDVSAERIVLGGLLQYGNDAFLDVSDILQETSFSDQSNRIIYNVISEIYKEDNNAKLDIPTIITSATKLGFGDKLKTNTEFKYLNTLNKVDIQLSNIRKFAGVLRKLEIARELQLQLHQANRQLEEVTGKEALNSILGIVENPIFNFANILRDNAGGPQLISSNIKEFIQHLRDNPRDIVGISTGFDYYDYAIGGGLRRKTVNMIGARPKTGKTMIALNIAKNIGKKKIKVLYLDTEMDLRTQQARLMACESGVEIDQIETGKFAQNNVVDDIINKAANDIEKLPISYINISGQPFEETLAIMRRWIAQEVGYTGSQVNDCVIILDYLKLMDSSNLNHNIAEFQELGFIMTSLHNFCVKYDVPALSFLQLNRDGIDEESTRVASGSDRIIWLCSNFTIFKTKSQEEIDIDGPEYGNRKLVPIVTRHGQGLDYGDYINVMFQGKLARVIETTTKSNIKKESPVTDDEQFEEGED